MKKLRAGVITPAGSRITVTAAGCPKENTGGMVDSRREICYNAIRGHPAGRLAIQLEGNVRRQDEPSWSARIGRSGSSRFCVVTARKLWFGLKAELRDEGIRE